MPEQMKNCSRCILDSRFPGIRINRVISAASVLNLNACGVARLIIPVI